MTHDISRTVIHPAMRRPAQASPPEAAPQAAAATSQAGGAAAGHTPDPRAILSSIGEVIYDWNIATDRLAWGPNVAEVLGIKDAEDIATGRAFAERLSAESVATRYSAIVKSDTIDTGAGVVYEIEYGLRRGGDKRSAQGITWIEDTGRWFAGQDGRPGRAHGIVRVISERHQAERELARQSRFDSLTGALNRGALVEAIVGLYAQVARTHGSFAVLVIAVDGLPVINHFYGYEVGEQVIAATAARLRANLRATDLIGRYTGNKFVLVLDSCDMEQLQAAGPRLLGRFVDKPLQTPAGPIQVSLRAGGVLAPRNGRSPQSLFMHAEQALDLARSQAAPAFVVYKPSLVTHDARIHALLIGEQVVTALDQNRIEIALEPIVAAATGEVVFYEALLRLRREDGVLLAPATILPIAEKTGLIHRLDRRILDLALERLSADPDLRLSINMSSSRTRDADWETNATAAFARHPGTAERLTIEITETCAIEDVEATRELLASMKKLGLKVAMDDFGAGHTSFRNLRSLHFDLIKIDGAFIQNLARSPDDRFFVRTLVDLARHLGIPIVAEWVEDSDTAALLRDWGVDYLQGTLFGRAEPGQSPPTVTSASAAA